MGEVVVIDPMIPDSVLVARTARNDIEYILSIWQKRMHLTHWTIEFEWDKELDPDETLAEINWHASYDSAQIRFSSKFAEWSRFFANTVVVHELMHLTARDLDTATKALEGQLPARVYDLFNQRVQYELEAVVDRVATLLVQQGGEV